MNIADVTINLDNINQYAFTNADIIKKPIKGLYVSFHGQGYMSETNEQNDYTKHLAELGILFIFPYYGPWNWMNKSGVKYTDALVEAAFKGFDLPDDTPIVSVGGSMGGLSALVYPFYAKRTPIAVAANCPVCDLIFHFTEHPELTRCIMSAFADYEGGIEEVLTTASPLHLAEKMPEMKYYIVHGWDDNAVNKQAHSDRFVKKMKELGADIQYIEVPNMGHCIMPVDEREKFNNFIEECILK